MPEGPHSVTVTPGDGQITVAWERGTGSQAHPVTASNSHDIVRWRDLNQLLPRAVTPQTGTGTALDDGWTDELILDDPASLSGRTRSTGADGFAQGTIEIDSRSDGMFTIAGWYRAPMDTTVRFGLMEALGDDATTWTRFFYPGDADPSMGLAWNVVAPDGSAITWEGLQAANAALVDGAIFRLQLMTRPKGGVDDGLEADLLSRSTMNFVWRLLLDNGHWLLLHIVRNSSPPVVNERAHEANRFFEAHCNFLGASASAGALSGRTLNIQSGIFWFARGTGAWEYHTQDRQAPPLPRSNATIMGLGSERGNRLPREVFWDDGVVWRPSGVASVESDDRVSSPHVITGLSNNEAYEISVVHRTDSGEDFETTVAQKVIPRAVVPAARATRTAVGRGVVRVVWDDDDESPPTYRVEWRMKGTTDWTTAVAGYRGTSYNLGGFDAGDEVEVRIVAGNDAGEAASETVSRTVARTVNELRIPSRGDG